MEAAGAEAYVQVAEFRAALREFLRRTERTARANGLTPQRYLLLLMIRGAPDGSEQSTVTELAERLKLAQSTVTELVRRAEEVGLIERQASTQDGRVAHLRLTEEGHRRLGRAFTERPTSGAERLTAPLPRCRLMPRPRVRLRVPRALSLPARTSRGSRCRAPAPIAASQPARRRTPARPAHAPKQTIPWHQSSSADVGDEGLGSECARAVASLAFAAGEVEVAPELARLALVLRADEDELVRVGEAAHVDVREQPRVRRVAGALEPVEVEPGERIDRRDLVDDKHVAPGARDARELGDDELGPCDVVERAQRRREVERRGLERETRGVCVDERDVGEPGARSRAWARSSGTMSAPTTSRTSGASARASAPAPVPTSSARSSPVGATNRRTRSASASARASCRAAIRSAVRAKRSRTASPPPGSCGAFVTVSGDCILDTGSFTLWLLLMAFSSAFATLSLARVTTFLGKIRARASSVVRSRGGFLGLPIGGSL